MDTTSRFRIDAFELAKESDKKPPADQPAANNAAWSTGYVKPPKTADSLDCLQLTGTVPPNVDLICAEDQRLALAYAYLGAMEYNGDTNDSHIILHHSLYEVTIKGAQLEPVYEALLERKALWIRQVNMNFLRRYQKLEVSNDNEPDVGPMVSDIRFVKKT